MTGVYFNPDNIDGVCFTCPNRGDLCEQCMTLFQEEINGSGRLIDNNVTPESVKYMKDLMKEIEGKTKEQIVDCKNFNSVFLWTPIRKQIYIYLVGHTHASRFEISTALNSPRSTVFDSLKRMFHAGFVGRFQNPDHKGRGRPQVFWKVIKNELL